MGVRIGNKNKIKNSTIIGDSQVNVSGQSEVKQKESFWKNIWQTLVSNLIWWIFVTIVIIIIGTVTALNWDTIIALILNR